MASRSSSSQAMKELNSIKQSKNEKSPESAAKKQSNGAVPHIPSLLPSTDQSEQIEAKMEQVFETYLEQVQDLGVVQGVLFGTNPQRGAFMWNIFEEDVSLDDDLDYSPYRSLNKLAYKLQREVRGVLRLRVAHVNPSDVSGLQMDCEKQKIQTELIALR